MLPELILDNESFEDIMDEARNMIVSLYPEWTDFNYHDPGITLIELFSWLKESQQFYLDQISDESRKKYLKLLGIKREHKKPARAVVNVEALEDSTVLPGTKLYAGRTCFQAEHRKQLIGGDVKLCFHADENGIIAMADRNQIKRERRLRLELFGRIPEEGACFYIGFDRSLPLKEELSVYLELTNEWDASRNPLDGEMPFPLAKLEMEFYGEDGWEPVTDFQDGTHGAIATGHLHFLLQKAMKETELWGMKGFFVRLHLKQESYDVTPVLQGISMNLLPLRQTEQLIEMLELDAIPEEEGTYFCTAGTILSLNGKNELYGMTGERCFPLDRFTKNSDFNTGISTFHFEIPGEEIQKIRLISYLDEDEKYRVLGRGTGFPYQEFDLNDSQVAYDGFALMVQENGSDPRICNQWRLVEDFSGSGPEDRHYILDAEKGIVQFGDCIHGMAPEGEILVAAYERTLGRRGNAKARSIDRFEGLEPEEIPVSNRDNAYGGRDEETLEECFLRARKELKRSNVAVSNEDYEGRVMETPGLILESCRVISSSEMRQMKKAVDETEINIVVKPFSEGREKGLSGCYRKNILSYMERYRMAGRKVHLMAPQYILFEVYVDIVILPHFVGARELVKQAVIDYFEKVGNQFGVSIQYAHFYGALDVLPCVSYINSLTVNAKGNGISQSKDGVIKLPPNGVARLGEAQYLFSIGE